MRPHWHAYLLGISQAVAERADCRRAKVGAVIVDPGNRIVSTGYNGTFPGRKGCLDGGCPRGMLTRQECPPGTAYDNCIAQHAEVNALLYSDRSRHEGGTIYITRQPCHWCQLLLCASGLHLAIWSTGDDLMVDFMALDLTSWD